MSSMKGSHSEEKMREKSFEDRRTVPKGSDDIPFKGERGEVCEKKGRRMEKKQLLLPGGKEDIDRGKVHS